MSEVGFDSATQMRKRTEDANTASKKRQLLHYGAKVMSEARSMISMWIVPHCMAAADRGKSNVGIKLSPSVVLSNEKKLVHDDQMIEAMQLTLRLQGYKASFRRQNGMSVMQVSW